MICSIQTGGVGREQGWNEKIKEGGEREHSNFHLSLNQYEPQRDPFFVLVLHVFEFHISRIIVFILL